MPKTHKQRQPARSIQGREAQLVSIAMDVAEEQMLNGSASAQIINHFLKMGSTREELEQQKVKMELELLDARIEGTRSAKRVEELYEQAIHAMRTYAGQVEEEDVELYEI